MVFSRKKAAPNLTQVQESNYGPKNENTGSTDSSLQSQSNNTSINPTNPINDLDLRIAVKKGTKVLKDHFIHCSSMFLLGTSVQLIKSTLSINTRVNPTNVSEALLKRDWRDAMKKEMSALKKNITLEIVNRPGGKKWFIVSGSSH